jgi:tRNA pseudouridine55 synthase
MFLLVDKPKGITSFDVIRVLRRTLDIKKIGHSGTLDPMATGGMILATDQDTKKLTGLIGLDKSYEAIIDLSKTSDTWDADYREQYEEIKVEKQPSKEEIEILLKSLVPEYLLPLPPFSAKKKDGKK